MIYSLPIVTDTYTLLALFLNICENYTLFLIIQPCAFKIYRVCELFSATFNIYKTNGYIKRNMVFIVLSPIIDVIFPKEQLNACIH